MNTKDIIVSLLKRKNIVKIIYVDNYFEKDCYKENASSFVRENFSNTEKKFPFEICTTDLEISQTNFNEWWEDAKHDEIKEFFDNNNIQRDLTDIEKALQQISNQDISYCCLTPDDFDKNYNKLNLDNENQLLILMDKFLNEDDVEGEGGIKHLSNFINKEYVSCGLFSNRFSIEQELENLNACNGAKNVYPLSKERINPDNYNDLLSGLRNVLWFNEISNIKELTISFYQKAISNLKDELVLFDPSSFYHAIIHSSRIEGCWEFDLIKRVVNLILNKEIEKVMTSEEVFAKIQSNTKTLKTMDLDSDLNSDLEKIPIPKTEFLKDLYLSEIYDDITYLNSTYSQISNGDIFSIKNKEYMLACQPCNLAIREDGSRKSKEFVYLLPIEDLDEEKDGKQTYISKLYGLHDEKHRCVKLSNYKRICPYILDLTSFNKDGKATLKLSQHDDKPEDFEYMQKNMLKVYKKIFNKISQYVQCCENLNSSNINNDSKKIITKLLTKPFEMASEKFIKVNKSKDENGNTIVDFGVKRINRYKEPYSQIVLQDFSNYLSRQSLPHDFSKQS